MQTKLAAIPWRKLIVGLLIAVLVIVLLALVWLGRFTMLLGFQQVTAQAAHQQQASVWNFLWRVSVQNPLYTDYLKRKQVPTEIITSLNTREDSAFIEAVEDLVQYIVHVDNTVRLAAAYPAQTQHVLQTAQPEVQRSEAELLDRYGYRIVTRTTELVEVHSFRVWFDGSVKAREIVGGELGDGATAIQLESISGGQSRQAMEAKLATVAASYLPQTKLYKFYPANPTTVDVVSNTDAIPIGVADILFTDCNVYLPVGVRYLISAKEYRLVATNTIDEFVCPQEKYATPVAIATCDDCMLFPADKWHALGADYVPLTAELNTINSSARVAPQLFSDMEAMFASMRAVDIRPRIASAYRSYTQQKATYQYWIDFLRRQDPKLTLEKATQDANRFSALPGFSEHQLGTVIDIAGEGCENFSLNCEQNVKVWNWMAENAYQYGFLISYPKGKESVTGYVHEPWHYRWLGQELAAQFPRRGDKTLNVWLRERYYQNLAETLSRQ